MFDSTRKSISHIADRATTDNFATFDFALINETGQLLSSLRHLWNPLDSFGAARDQGIEFDQSGSMPPWTASVSSLAPPVKAAKPTANPEYQSFRLRL